ncbi:MAG: cupin domain-containing protein [Chloroflexi bacterium]|nr:cupin domain-containing protein [Chloroflexota bacterium]
MRRLSVLISVVLFVALSALALVTTRTAAQEATPAGTPTAASAVIPLAPSFTAVIELSPGVTAEVFASAPSERAPDQTVYLARFVFQPDAEIFPHRHPGTVVLGVTSGSLGWTLVEGTAHVVRGAAAGATGPAEDLSEPGTEVILEPGDAIYYEDDVVHTARGAGDEETVVFGTLVLTSGEDLLMPTDMDMSATPAS